jgi:hypothetical protein
VETLGEVRLSSGMALVVDTGLLGLWCHDRRPWLPDGVLPTEEATESANRGQDFRIEGPDAVAAGRAFHRQWLPRSLFDIPAHGVAQVEQSFRDVVSKAGLCATLVPSVRRVPHLRRAELAVDEGGGGGEFLMQGIPLVAVGGLPKNTVLSVVGERRGGTRYPTCWSWIALDLGRGAAVADSVPCGVVGVDWARVMFVDPLALGAWRHEEPIDGLADFVCWGRDAEVASKRFGLSPLEDGHFGIVDRPVDEVVEQCAPVEAAVKRGELKIATDFRPHSHHHALLEQMRRTPTESGTLDLDGTRCCAFFTSWGDGLFPVHRDLDARGELVRVRIELSNETSLRNMDAVNGGR